MSVSARKDENSDGQEGSQKSSNFTTLSDEEWKEELSSLAASSPAFSSAASTSAAASPKEIARQGETVSISRRSRSEEGDGSNNGSDNDDDDDDGLDVCWICQGLIDEMDPRTFIKGACNCVGSLGIVHRKCIDHWVLGQRHQSCAACKVEYRLLSSYNQDAPALPEGQWSQLWFLHRHFLRPFLWTISAAIFFALVRFMAVPYFSGLAYFKLQWLLHGHTDETPFIINTTQPVYDSWMNASSESLMAGDSIASSTIPGSESQTGSSDNSLAEEQPEQFLVGLIIGFELIYAELIDMFGSFVSLIPFPKSVFLSPSSYIFHPEMIEFVNYLIVGMIPILGVRVIVNNFDRWKKYFEADEVDGVENNRPDPERLEGGLLAEGQAVGPDGQQKAFGTGSISLAEAERLAEQEEEKLRKKKELKAKKQEAKKKQKLEAARKKLAAEQEAFSKPSSPTGQTSPPWTSRTATPFDRSRRGSLGTDGGPTGLETPWGASEDSVVGGGGSPLPSKRSSKPPSRQPSKDNLEALAEAMAAAAQDLPLDDQDNAGGGEGGNAEFTQLEVLMKLSKTSLTSVGWPNSKDAIQRWGLDIAVTIFSLFTFALVGALNILIIIIAVATIWRIVRKEPFLKREQQVDRLKIAMERRKKTSPEKIKLLFGIYAFDVAFFSGLLPCFMGLVAHYSFHGLASDCNIWDFQITPFSLIVHWMCGAMILVSFVRLESALMMPLFAPGIDFFVLRSIDLDAASNMWSWIHGQVMDLDPLKVLIDFCRVGTCELVAIAIIFRAPFEVYKFVLGEDPFIGEGAVPLLHPVSPIGHAMVALSLLGTFCMFVADYPIRKPLLLLLRPIARVCSKVFFLDRYLFDEEKWTMVGDWLTIHQEQDDLVLPPPPMERMMVRRDRWLEKDEGYVPKFIRLRVLGFSILFFGAFGIFLSFFYLTAIHFTTELAATVPEMVGFGIVMPLMLISPKKVLVSLLLFWISLIYLLFIHNFLPLLQVLFELAQLGTQELVQQAYDLKYLLGRHVTTQATAAHLAAVGAAVGKAMK